MSLTHGIPNNICLIEKQQAECQEVYQQMSDDGKRVEVKAVMSGVFHTRPSPQESTYVEVGDTVKKKQVLALLETMKVFQKVKSPADGTVTEILIENETPVMDGELLMVLKG